MRFILALAIVVLANPCWATSIEDSQSHDRWVTINSNPVFLDEPRAPGADVRLEGWSLPFRPVSTVTPVSMMVDGTYQNGNENFTIRRVLDEVPPPRVERNDFDGDGSSDLLAINTETGEVGVALLEDAVIQAFDVLLSIDASAGWTVHASGDFNGDGKADMVLVNTITGEIIVARIDGTTLVDGDVVHTYDPVSGLAPQGVGDFDGDGKAEIILYDSATGDLSLVFLDGLAVSSIEPVGQIDVSTGWTLRDTGDFNKDGKTDFFLYNTVIGGMFILEMDGVSLVSSHGFFELHPLTRWFPNGVGDFDGDGDDDVELLISAGTVVILVQETFAVTRSYAIGKLAPGWEPINIGQYDTTDSKADLFVFDPIAGDLFTILQDGTTITAINTIVSLDPNTPWTFHPGTP